MKSTFSKDISEAFLINEASAKKIFKLLSNRIGEVEITAYCIDDTKREFQSIQQLLNYENASQSKILRLRFIAKSEDHTKRAEVDFNSAEFRGITIEVIASDTVTSRLRSSLLELIDGCCPWYSIPARANFFAISLLGIAAFVVYIMGGVTFGFIEVTEKPSTSTSSISNQFMALLFVASAFGVSGLLQASKSRLFPFGHFLIGQQIATFALLEKIRWGVLISLLVSLAAGLILG